MWKRISVVTLALIAAFIAGFLLTATGAIAAPQQRLRYVQIVGEVFLDTAGYNYNLPCPGCNGYWDNADWCGELYTPLPEVTLILKDAETGEEISRKAARKNYNNGREWAYFSVPARDSGFILEVEAVPEGFESCPTSPLSRLLTPRDLRHGQRLERFYFWWGCPPAPPESSPPQPPPPPGTGTNGYFYGCGVYPIFDPIAP